MAKEIETIICEVCESQYKLVYDINETSGFRKFCCFCGEINTEEEEDQIDDDEGEDN